MVMQSIKNLFGFFPPVDNAESARKATKLSGLTAFVFGAFLCFPLFTDLVYRASGAIEGIAAKSLALAAIGLLMMICAFMIRRGSLTLIPIIVPLMLVVLAYWIVTQIADFLTIAGALFDRGDAVATITVIFLFLFRIFVPFALVALAINGLRGWNWLRRH